MFCSTTLFRNAFRRSKLLCALRSRWEQNARACLCAKCPLRFSDANKIWCRDIFLRKIPRHESFMEIRSAAHLKRVRTPVRDAYWLPLIRPSGRRYGSTPTAHISVKFHIGDFDANTSRKTQICLKSDKNIGKFTRRPKYAVLSLATQNRHWQRHVATMYTESPLTATCGNHARRTHHRDSVVTFSISIKILTLPILHIKIQFIPHSKHLMHTVLLRYDLHLYPLTTFQNTSTFIYLTGI